MFDHLGPAMRRALAATRASDLAQATRVLQDALGGAPKDGARAQASLQPSLQPSLTETTPLRRRNLGETLAALRGGAHAQQLRPMPRPRMPDGCAFLERRMSTPWGARDYRLFVPSASNPRGLVVMLHGCKQDAEDFAVGTTMNLAAEAEGMLVCYPTQPRSANPSGCWNWFRPEDQGREVGEPRIIAEMTRALIAEYTLGQRVFAAGLSAGGAMAAVMAATHPELYEAVGIHSGLPYRSARDVASALAAMRGGHRGGGNATMPSSMPRQIVFHGSEDHTVVPANARMLMEAARCAHDHAQVLERRFTSGLRQVQHTAIVGRDGISKAETWLVEGAGHHWFGGDPAGSYAKPEGPNASREMMRFFLRRQLQH